MDIPKPLKVTVEFDDGSTTEADFESLTVQFQRELLKQPVFSRPMSNPDERNFVLIQWKDGWKEVAAVDSGCSAINRYYVIRRPEDVGRLSLTTKSGYPELIEIIRDPLNLEKIRFIATFRVAPKKTDREGSKLDHFFDLEEENDAFSEMLADFKDIVSQEQIDLGEFKSKDHNLVRTQYQEIASKMGIRAAHRQQDLLDFMGYLTKCTG